MFFFSEFCITVYQNTLGLNICRSTRSISCVGLGIIFSITIMPFVCIACAYAIPLFDVDKVMMLQMLDKEMYLWKKQKENRQRRCSYTSEGRAKLLTELTFTLGIKILRHVVSRLMKILHGSLSFYCLSKTSKQVSNLLFWWGAVCRSRDCTSGISVRLLKR